MKGIVLGALNPLCKVGATFRFCGRQTRREVPLFSPPSPSPWALSPCRVGRTCTLRLMMERSNPDWINVPTWAWLSICSCWEPHMTRNCRWGQLLAEDSGFLQKDSQWKNKALNATISGAKFIQHQCKCNSSFCSSENSYLRTQSWLLPSPDPCSCEMSCWCVAHRNWNNACVPVT